MSLRSTFALSLMLAASATVAAADRIPTRADEVKPVEVGQTLPDAPITRLDGSLSSLRQEVVGRPTVLVVYRGGWCPYCNTQLRDLRDAEAELIAAGYRIVAVSPDRPSELARTSAGEKLRYTLLSDSSAAAIAALGLAFRVDDAGLSKLKASGIDLERSSGQTHHLLPVPAVFVIDRKGVVRYRYANPDYKVRAPIQDVTDAARRISAEDLTSKLAPTVKFQTLRFELPDAHGRNVSFPKAAAGRPSLVLFWATWCPYCKKLMPHLQRLIADRRPAVEWFAISIMDDGDPVATLAERHQDPVLLVKGDALAASLNVRGTPFLIVTDAEGQIIYRGPTTSDYDEEGRRIAGILDQLVAMDNDSHDRKGARK